MSTIDDLMAQIEAALESALRAEYERGRVAERDSGGWLVEHSGEFLGAVQGRISWLYVQMKAGGYGAREFGFTHDATVALRFARREDAEAVLALHIGINPPDWYSKPYSVTEHLWLGSGTEREQAGYERGQDAGPVAWLARFVNKNGKEDVYVTTHHDLAVENDANGKPTPLYAAPPRRKPLTDEQMDAISGRCHQQGTTDDGAAIMSAQDLIDYGRLVERAHGIGDE